MGARVRTGLKAGFVGVTAIALLSGFQGADVSGDLAVSGFGLPDEIATVRVDTFEQQYPDVNLNLTEGLSTNSSF